MKPAALLLFLVTDALLVRRFERTQATADWLVLGRIASRRIGEHRRVWALLLAQ
jgi:hypothetical protein